MAVPWNKAVFWSFTVFFLIIVTVNHLNIDKFVGPAADKSMTSSSTAMSNHLIHVNFEVFGRVQGVFFRKYTQQQATKLALVGWCRNTASGSVEGEMEGPEPAVDNMVTWLQRTGSPQSRIDRAEFTDRKPIDSLSFKNFAVRH